MGKVSSSSPGKRPRRRVRFYVPPPPLPRHAYPARSVEATTLLERFFVSAVVAILLIRAWLALTGYPQIGGDGLHIAHVLFGGIGMLIALLASLTFLGRRSRVFAAIVGGAGFGAFIDELGKFITSDNNYFYQPTIALIYVVFVLLFIAGERLATDSHPHAGRAPGASPRRSYQCHDRGVSQARARAGRAIAGWERSQESAGARSRKCSRQNRRDSRTG